MRSISFIIGGLRGGGAEQVCVTLANGFVAKGWRVELVVLGLEGAVRHLDLDSEIKLINLNVSHARYSVFQLFKYLKTNKPKIVLSFNRQLSVILALVRLVAGFNFRLISRNIIFLSIAENEKKGMWHGLISKYIIKIFYPMSDKIIAQSSAMKEDLIAYLGVKKENVVVINNPVNVHVEKFSEYFNIENEKKCDYLLCVGRLEKQKAFHYAIEVFSRIKKDFPDLRLKIVGQGSLDEDLIRQAKELGVSNEVDFEGYQKNIIPYYLGARVTLLTSLYEGFPNVLVESIAIGTPVVAFDCPSGPNEIVKSGVNGYLVSVGDVNEMEKKIDKALSIKWNFQDVKQSVSHLSSDEIINRYIECMVS